MKRGFALVSVLWVMVGIGTLAMASLLVARETVAASRNRTVHLRGRWRAEACLARSRIIIDASLSQTPDAWRTLDRIVAVTGCDVTLAPANTSVDINTAGPEQLRALWRALGRDAASADSLTDALLDWRDADDDPRPLGAERAWYLAHGQYPPRNGPLGDWRELRRVRGFDVGTFPDSVLAAVVTVEPGPIVWDRAPLAVLASLPGVGEEVLTRVAQARASGRALEIGDLVAATSPLSPPARAALIGRVAEVQSLISGEPAMWLLIAHADGATVEVELVPGAARAAIMGWRTLP